ncbi:MAG: hypothetical protein OHK005_01230 [Candidatus Methylacidiphilales bacterium]
MKLKKVFRATFLFLVLSVAALPSVFAVPDLRVSQQETTEVIDVGIFDTSGALVKSLAMGTIREKVSAAGQEFVVSFGQNPAGNAVLIISPDPENPRDITLRVSGRRLAISRDAVITVIFPRDPNTRRLGDPLIRPGLVGTVSVDGRRLSPDTLVSLGTSLPVAIAQSTPPVPSVPTQNTGTSGGGSDDVGFTPLLDPSSFQPGGSSGFPGMGPLAPLAGLGPFNTLTQVPSSFSGFLSEIGGFLGGIGINLNPAAATPTVPEQT